MIEFLERIKNGWHMKVNCITFDKQAKDSLPEDIKRQMKADRDKAREDKNKYIKIMNKSIEEKAYGLASDRATGSPVNAYMNGFEDGLKEALRWREVEKEPIPDNVSRVLVADCINAEVYEKSSYAASRFWKYWRPLNLEGLG